MTHPYFDRNFVLIRHLARASVVPPKQCLIRTSLSSLPRDMSKTSELITYIGSIDQATWLYSKPVSHLLLVLPFTILFALVPI
jgi:hypothetical protein